MTVDFAFKRAPACRVACLPASEKFSDAAVRSQFERIARWARDHRYRTGRWLFLYLDKPSDDRFQAPSRSKDG